ncbi:MAG: hypothetical protein ACKO3P_10110, partial [Planctomycetaceae bacterium]
AELASGQTASPGPGTADVASQTVAVGPSHAARSEGEPGEPGEGIRSATTADAAASPGWDWLAGTLARWPGLVAATATLAMLACGWGLARLETSVRIETLFAPDSRLMRDYAWLERILGPLVPVEVVLHCDVGCQLSSLERLALVTRLEQELALLTNGGGTLSAATFTPRLESPPGVDPARFARMVEALFDQGRSQLIDVGYLHTDRRGESWRITGRVSALAAIDYGVLLRQVDDRLNKVLREATSGAGPGNPPDVRLAAAQLAATPGNRLPAIEGGSPGPLREAGGVAGWGPVGQGGSLKLTCTGIMPVVQGIQQQLFDDLLASFVSALVVITLVMIVVQG